MTTTHRDADFEHGSHFNVTVAGRGISGIKHTTRLECGVAHPCNLPRAIVTWPIINSIVGIEQRIVAWSNLHIDGEWFDTTRGVLDFVGEWFGVAISATTRVVGRQIVVVRDFVTVIIKRKKIGHPIMIGVGTRFAGSDEFLWAFDEIIGAIMVGVCTEWVGIEFIA